ncbi:MAG: aminotransferase class V-fold PLP-dependent enzyme [Erysipelotrichaceae bacterium]|nr:aminotransferase class V-fold PLP-dependent enzyme [Erysipelotrichaceae bacterium]
MNKTAEKIFRVLPALLLCCTLTAGCSQQGQSDSDAQPEETQEAEEVKYTIDNIRDYVVGVDEPVELADGTKQPLINFDNAATTPPLKPVMEAIDNEMKMYGSIGRGFSEKSNHSTDLYREARETVMKYVNANLDTNTAIYVNSTTDGLNKLASALIESEDDIVLATRMEHHADDLPWRERCQVVYAEVDEQGRIIYDDMERLLDEYDGKIKYVCVTAASNVTGYITDVHRVAKMAHEHGAMIIVDGAQIVAHREFSMQGETPEEDIDFFVFSAHKMYSPYGGGAIVGPWDILDKHMPEFYGGGIVNIVTDSTVSYKHSPESYEAGSPNYAAVVGMAKAMEILKEVGFDAIEEHEKKLNARLIEGLKKIDNIIIYGDTENIDDRVGVVSFNFNDINSYIMAVNLAEKGGIATRRGAFCAHTYVWRLMGISDEEAQTFVNCIDMKTPGMIRVSFGIYNTEEEVDKFLEVLSSLVDESRETTKLSSEAKPEY